MLKVGVPRFTRVPQLLVYNLFYAANIIWCFSMDERTNILRILSDRKIFLIKGAVPRVARMLGCSEPTVYRGIKSCEAMN